MEPGTTALRWMWIWITLSALIVIVVIGFLFGITSSLNSIDDGLAEANNAVSGAGGDVKPLPAHIQSINGSLVRIDEAAKPLSRQADEIIDELRSIDGRLKTTNASLTDTDSRLRTTNTSLTDTRQRLVQTGGSLVNTSSTLQDVSVGLVTILSQVNRISGVLVDAQRPELEGTNAIWRRVRFLNGGRFRPGGNINRRGLVFAEDDARLILGRTPNEGLRAVNKHLTSICRQIPTPPPRC